MSEETRRIIEMINNETITQEEGDKLIEALYKKEEPKKSTGKKSTLRVRIDTSGRNQDNNTTVNINIPLILAKKMSGLTNLVPKNPKNDLAEEGIALDSIDLAELIEMFENGEIGEDLINIDVGDGDDLTRVRVYVD